MKVITKIWNSIKWNAWQHQYDVETQKLVNALVDLN